MRARTCCACSAAWPCGCETAHARHACTHTRTTRARARRRQSARDTARRRPSSGQTRCVLTPTPRPSGSAWRAAASPSACCSWTSRPSQVRAGAACTAHCMLACLLDACRPLLWPERGACSQQRAMHGTAGVGNIYRAEILFKAAVHPEQPGNSLSRAQVGWPQLAPGVPRLRVPQEPLCGVLCHVALLLPHGRAHLATARLHLELYSAHTPPRMTGACRSCRCGATRRSCCSAASPAAAS